VYFFNPTPVPIPNPNGITGCMVFAIPLIAGIHMDGKYRPLEELMGRQGYSLPGFLHFYQLNAPFMDRAIMFSLADTNHSVHSFGL
jgi:hypothetical protein